MSSRFTSSDFISAYDKWHAQKSASNDDPLGFPWYASVIHESGGMLAGNVLEVGCGRGEFAHWLASARPNVRVSGVDLSRAAIEIAKQRSSAITSSVQFFVGDAQSLKFPDGTFDWVVSCECMEHVPSPRVMAKEIFRVLKPGGRFCVTTENYLNGMLLAWLRCWLTGRPFNSGSGVQPRENFFLFFQVRKYLSDAGLVVEKTSSCHYQWLLLPKIDPARLCTFELKSNWGRFLAKPFGRHFSFFGYKP